MSYDDDYYPRPGNAPWWVRLRGNVFGTIGFGLGWLIYHIGLLFFFVGVFFVNTFRLLVLWWQTRQIRHLILGLPALIVAVVLVILFMVHKKSTQGLSTVRYHDLADSAIKEKDFELAVLAYQRILLLDGDTDHNRFKLAQAHYHLGNKARSQVLLESASPLDRIGDPEAHFNRALQLSQNPKRSPQDLRAMELHLLRTLQEQPDHMQAQSLLGRYYLATKQQKKAKQHLTKAAETLPELNLFLSRIYYLEKNPKLEMYATRARDHFQQKVKADVDNHDARLHWAEMLLILKEHRQAVEVLSEGWRITASPVYQKAIANTYANWSDRETKNLGTQLQLLQSGLAVAPNHPPLLERLVKLARTPGKEGAKVKSIMKDLLAQGKSADLLHFFLGADACLQKNYQAAQIHFEQAKELNPKMPALANNLAWLIVQQKDKKNYDYALELINFAIKQSPDELHFRETRGQVYVKLQRWKEALKDLQAGLPLYRDDPTTHSALAEVYQHLHLPEMADRHKEMAKKLSKGS